MKKLLVVLLMMALLLQTGAMLTVGATETQSYHSSLITHWDFEGDSTTVYQDKSVGGVSADTLAVNGTDIVVKDGVAYIPNTKGTYLSAAGGEGTDLNDLKNTTIVFKAALVNHEDGRGSVAAFASKGDAYAYVLQNEEGKNALTRYVRVNGGNNTADSTGTNVVSTVATVMNEFRIFTISFDYVEANGSENAKLKVNYYMSTKEVPESGADFVKLMDEQVIEVTTQDPVVQSDADFILGRRQDHLNKDRKLLCYFDDVKVYSEVLTTDQIAADCPGVTSYQINVKEEEQETVYYEKLKNLTMYAIGDSYFAGHGGVGVNNAWPSLFASKYDMTKTVDAIGGSTVANWSGYLEERPPMVLRYKNSLPTDNVDIILIEGGRNDRGTIPIGTNDSTDINTFKGALNVMISDMKTKFPNALIICVTAWNAQDKTNPSTVEYAEAMVELCASRDDVKCINAADPEVSGVDINVAEFRQKYCIGPDDHSHLNADGMKLVLPYFEESIARLYYEHIGETFVDQTPGQYYKETSNDNGNGGNNGENGGGTEPPAEDNTNAPETNASETNAPETNTPVTNDNGSSSATSGCGSSLGLSAITGATIASAFCTLNRKKRKSEQEIK